MKTRFLFTLVALAVLFSVNSGWAQEAFKIGLIPPMTGQSWCWTKDVSSTVV